MNMQFAENSLCYRGDRELPGLQVLKLVAALMVIQIHIVTPLRLTVLPLCQIAVPVFFMISGYFLPDSHGCITRRRVGKSLLKVLRIALWANAVYLLFSMVDYAFQPDLFVDTFLNVMFWLRLLFSGNLVAGHLWYLTAFIEAFAVLWIMAGTRKFRLLYLFIPLGIALNLATGRYGFMFFDSGFPIEVSRNFLTVGLPCILTGILLRRYERIMPGRRVVVTAICVLTVALYVECYLLKWDEVMFAGDIVVFTLPLSVMVFLFFMRFSRTSGVFGVLTRWGRDYSTDIYLWHFLVLAIVSKVLLMVGVDNTSYTAHGCVVVVTFAVAVALRRYRKAR